MAEESLPQRHRFASGSLARSRIEQDDCDYVVKGILLGDVGVGKTSFLHTFKHGACPPRGRTPRIGAASADKIIPYRDKKVKVILWDTAGQERYRSLTTSYYRGAHLSIIMYDVTNEESFRHIPQWVEEVRQYGDPFAKTVVVIVGNRTFCQTPNSAANDSNSGPAQQHRRRSQTTNPLPPPGASAPAPSSSSDCSDVRHRQQRHQQPGRLQRCNSLQQTAGSERHNSLQRQPSLRRASQEMVPRSRAESFAAYLKAPHFEVDLQRDSKELMDLMINLVAMVITNAEHHQRTPQPYHITAQPKPSKPPSCTGCCSA